MLSSGSNDGSRIDLIKNPGTMISAIGSSFLKEKAAGWATRGIRR
jgi:hypothetical protein